MTRHNLNGHLTWLLSYKVTSPVGVPASTSTHPAAAPQTVHGNIGKDTGEDIGEDRQQEFPRARSIPAPERRIIRTVNAVGGITRPAATIVPKTLPDIAEVLANDAMGKLTSASRPARPTLMSQQLATPASTIASANSLTSGYSKFLRGGKTKKMLFSTKQ